MTDVEIAVGVLATWMARPDAGQEGAVALRVVHELVATKLGQDPALARLAVEAGGGEVSPRTRTRLALALEEAVEDDSGFARELAKAIKELRDDDLTETGRGSVTNTITGSVTGEVIQARDIHGSVSFGRRGR